MPPKRKRNDISADAQSRQERQTEVTSIMEHLNSHETLDMLEEYSQKWQLHLPDRTFDQITSRFFQILGKDSREEIDLTNFAQSFGIGEVDAAIHREELQTVALYHKLREHKLLEEPTNLNKIVRILEQLYYAKKVVLSSMQSSLSLHAQFSEDLHLDADLEARLASWCLRFRWVDVASCNALQRLLIHLLDRANDLRLRRHGEYCFEPLFDDTGRYMHCWKPRCEIRKFVYEQTSKEDSWEAWSNLLASSNNAKAATEFLISCKDHQFKDLIQRRDVFAFPNGVYDAKLDRFTPHEQVVEDVVACKFFPQPFPVEYLEQQEEHNWREIPTPHLQSILDYQLLPQEVSDWLYVFIGRCIYEVNSMDSWQVCPFFLGAASSGKSTICLQVIARLYESHDVGVLSNNKERLFGLQPLYNKLLVVAPEIKGDLSSGLEQCEFQSMISGESISIAIKNKPAVSCKWKAGLALAGNEIPSYVDNSSSIQRRLVVFSFEKSVIASDNRLGEKLELEMPLILLKSNRAYLEAVQRYGSQNIWTALPPYFTTQRQMLSESVNSLESWLSSGDVRFGTDLYCPLDEVKAALRVYEQIQGFPKGKYTQQFLLQPLSKRNLHMTGVETRQYKGRNVRKIFVIGMDLIDEDQQQDNNNGTLG